MTAALDQLCSSRTRICVLEVSQAFIGNDFERTAVTEKARLQPSERLPTLHRDVDVAWLQFHPQTDSAGRLGSDQRRAAAEKWVINSDENERREKQELGKITELAHFHDKTPEAL